MQRLAARASRISSAVGAGLSASSSWATTIMPGVQKPHCSPWHARNVSCSGLSPSAGVSPSIVVTAAPSHCTASSRQARALQPSTSTVHAPQTPCSQPTCVPVSPRSSRRKSLSERRPSISRSTGSPLTVRRVAMAIHDSVSRNVPLLEVRGLQRSFYGVRALDGVDLVVEPGTITGLIGPNGAGKTTLFNCVSGLIPPEAGRVLFDGRDVTGWRADRVTQAGLVRTFQIARGFPRLSVLENLLLYGDRQPGESLLRAIAGRAAARRREAELTERALAVARRLSLTRVIDNPASDLSGGQKKLLELGRALMTDPKLILLDEPIAGVNPTLARELAEHLRVLRPPRGRVLLGDTPIEGRPPREISALGVAFVPQERNVFPTLSVRENLEMAGYLEPRKARPRIEAIFARFPLLAERRRSAARTLSGGQRQILAMAMALIAAPSLLPPDEPPAGRAPPAPQRRLQPLAP